MGNVIVVGVDGTSGSQRAVEWTAQQASESGAEVVAVLAVRATMRDSAAPREPDRFRSWLLKIVANVSLGKLRRDLGSLTSLDEPVSRYLPDARHRYTLRHLLTMTAGTEAGGAWEIDEVMARPSGWVDWILTAPSKREPGAAFGYDNGSIHVLGAALAAAVGRPLSAYARRHLFTPLGIDAFEWPRDPDGVDYGFGHLRLRPRDIAKLGELYLGGGTFAGRRLLAREFVEAATRAQTAGGVPEGASYGYLWWTAQDPVPHFFAAGYAGQSLTVIPELGLVAVAVGDEARLRPGWRNARHAVLAAFAE